MSSLIQTFFWITSRLCRFNNVDLGLTGFEDHSNHRWYLKRLELEGRDSYS